MEDEEIVDTIPWEFMYRNPKCVLILAAKVHQLNPEIAVDTACLPAGPSRSEQRRISTEANASAARKRKADADADTSARIAALKVMGLESAVAEQETKVIVQQLDMTERFRDSIVAKEGEAAYHNKVCGLLGDFPRKGQAVGGTPIASSSDEEASDEDEQDRSM
mmetsp:Transcript_8035/g.22480  ORF Transcript_8035/g.22480 Transcript_8035/m.22480 type:complete len:164 (+) Transcript_8035:400-891(+)